jgi:hypothetical protein
LLAHDWVVYAKKPLGGPEQVLEYLGHYTQRVAISNERLVGMDATTFRFRVRATPGKRVLSVPAEEFIDRFLLHVLPSGFKRIRHYGLLAPAAKATRLALARQALSVPLPDPVITATVEDFLQRVDRAEWARCPPLPRGTVRADGGDSAPASGDAAERIGSRTPMKTVNAWRGAFPCAHWQFRPPGDASSAACRSHDSGAAVCLPERPVRSCHALANSRKPLVCLWPTRLTHARGLTQRAGRLQSP